MAIRPSPKVDPPSLGFKGRIAIHELVLVSDTMRSLISHGAGTHEMVQEARKLGYRPLRYDGLKKALMGLTTLDEIERVTPLEWNI
jgi:type IV pilus assembly protein PilB